MTASPEVWRFVYGWMAFYFAWMVLVAVLTYEDKIGIGWLLVSISSLVEQIQGLSALF